MPELILIFIVALLVFGPRKLPEIGKSIGKGLAEFKRASDDLKRTIEQEIEQGKHEVASVRDHIAAVVPAATVTAPVSADVSNSGKAGQPVEAPQQALAQPVPPPDSRPIEPS